MFTGLLYLSSSEEWGIKLDRTVTPTSLSVKEKVSEFGITNNETSNIKLFFDYIKVNWNYYDSLGD